MNGAVAANAKPHRGCIRTPAVGANVGRSAARPTAVSQQDAIINHGSAEPTSDQASASRSSTGSRSTRARRRDTTRNSLSSGPVAGAAVRADGSSRRVLVGSGYREPPALARRNDGRVPQLRRRYLVLASLDGRRSYEEVAERAECGVSALLPATTSGSLTSRRSLGLLAKEDGSRLEVKKSNPLLRFKYAVTDPQWVVGSTDRSHACSTRSRWPS